jgi:mannosyltransferase OCH1-like enzyme
MRRLLANWEYRLWDDVDTRALFREHFPEYSARFDAIKRGVVRADIARCGILYAEGGFYFDTDYRLLRPIDNELLRLSCILPVSRGHPNDTGSFLLGNAVMASRPGHPFWRDFVAWIFAKPDIEETPEHLVEGTAGPEGLTRFYLAHARNYSDLSLRPRSDFHPPIKHRLFYSKTAYGAHLCWGSWRSERAASRLKTLVVRKVTAI